MSDHRKHVCVEWWLFWHICVFFTKHTELWYSILRNLRFSRENWGKSVNHLSRSKAHSCTLPKNHTRDSHFAIHWQRVYLQKNVCSVIERRPYNFYTAELWEYWIRKRHSFSSIITEWTILRHLPALFEQLFSRCTKNSKWNATFFIVSK